MSEKTPFLDDEGRSTNNGLAADSHPGIPAVTLTPAWELGNLPDDTLNFRTLSASMDRLDLEINPPQDR